MSRSSRASPKKKAEPETCEDILDRIYHPEKICKLPITSLVPKSCIFKDFRPKEPGKLLDYNISETDTKLDAGIVKLHLRQTVATYVKLPKRETPVDEYQLKLQAAIAAQMKAPKKRNAHKKNHKNDVKKKRAKETKKSPKKKRKQDSPSPAEEKETQESNKQSTCQCKI